MDIDKEYADNEKGGLLTKGEAELRFAQADYVSPVYKDSAAQNGDRPVARRYTPSNLIVDSQELSSAPVGGATILCEVIGRSGVLREVWHAVSAGGNGITSFSESGGRVKVYVNDATTPHIDMTLNDFFMYGTRGGVFDTPYFGRTAREANGDSGAYRRLHIPFQKYLRVELVNTTGAAVAPVYGSATYTIDDGENETYHLIGSRANRNPYERITVCDVSGAGQLESLYIAGRSTESGDYAFLEGNVEIYVNGSTSPQILSSGAEDFFAGAWYRVPSGGFPTGRAGDPDYSGSSIALWKFFSDQPVVFESGLKVIVNVGQRTQGTMKAAWYDLAAYAGVIREGVRSGSYPTEGSPARVRDAMSYPAGSLSGTPYSQPQDRAQATFDGTGLVYPYNTTDTGMDMRVVRTGLSLPSAYNVEGKIKINGNGDTTQEIGLTARGQGDGYYGDAVHLQLVRVSQYVWQVRAREGFSTIHQLQIGSGQDFADRYVWLRLRVEGTKITAFWRYDDNDHWRSIGSWTTAMTGTATGTFSWQGGGKVDQFNVVPIVTGS